jgi:hypothetical protein
MCLRKGEEREEFVATLSQACYDAGTTLASGTLEGRVSSRLADVLARKLSISF